MRPLFYMLLSSLVPQILVVARREVDGGGWVKWIKGIKSTFILMSIEKCVELSNHYTLYS